MKMRDDKENMFDMVCNKNERSAGKDDNVLRLRGGNFPVRPSGKRFKSRGLFAWKYDFYD